MPGTRFSRSATLVGCKRSISTRVNIVLAALLLSRCSTTRLAVIRVSDSFNACSWEAGWAANARLGASATARAIRDSFILDPQKVGVTFEEGRKQARRGRVLRDGRRHLTVMPSATPVTLHAGRPPDSWRSSAHLPMLRHSGHEQTPIVIGASYRCGGSAGIVRRTHRLSVSRLNQAHLHE